MQPKRRLIEEPFRTAHVLHDRGLRDPVQFLFLVAREILRRVNDDRQVLIFPADLVDQLEAGHVGQHQIEDHAIES